MGGLKSRFLGHHFTSKYNNPGVFKDTASKQLSLYHFSKVMTDLVDHFKAQSLSEKGIALSDVSHDY
jgi:hypothetical protein